MTDKEMEFQVLLKELDHADRQIGSYMDLQLKILGFVFALLGASLGLLLTTGQGKTLTPHNAAKLLVIVSIVSSFAVIQSTIYYGIALGYIHHKAYGIALRLQRLIGLSEPPLQALAAFQQGPTNKPVLISTFIFSVGILALNAGALWSAGRLVSPNSYTEMLIYGAALLIAASAACQGMTVHAMKQVGIAGSKSPATANSISGS